MSYKWYRCEKSSHIEAKPYEPDVGLPDGISISEHDRDNGSPKRGDWIARDPDNPEDTWLISREYFNENYRVIS